MKTQRQATILDVVDRHAITSQEDLRRRLTGLGFSVTQATLSRDIQDLGLVKAAADGAYHRPGGEGANPQLAASRLQHAVAEYMTSLDRVDQLIVAKTGAGHAQLLALAIDRAAVPEVVGTIGGDDTVLIICRDSAAAAAVVGRLDRLTKG